MLSFPSYPAVLSIVTDTHDGLSFSLPAITLLYLV